LPANHDSYFISRDAPTIRLQVSMKPEFLAIGVSLLLLTGIFIFIDLGFRFGRRRKTHDPEAASGSSTIEAAVFGLLGLTLAFTFAGAADRFAIRRDQIVQEANTIGTAYLRLDLLPTEDQPAIRALFRQYLETRIEVYDKFTDRAASSAALNKGNQLQREIWTRCVAATQKAPRPEPGLLLLQALNEMIDMTTTRTMAALIHAPIVVTGLLVVLSLFGALLAGFAMSAQPRRNLLHQILFGLAITCTIYVVLDLEYPRIGLINLTSIDRVIVDLREMMK